MNREENIYEIDNEKINNLESPDVFFSAKGILKKAKGDFQLRSQQKEMSEKVLEAFMKEKNLFTEAGTGTGKSFAYLYPAILHHLLNEERVIISTQTITLQEQVFLKDLPFLEKILEVSVRKAIAKGRGNYLCLRKAMQKKNDTDILPEEKDFINKIIIWVSGKTEGDREELGLNYNEKNLWQRISSNSEDCFGSSCPKYKECYYFKQKRKIERSGIIVTNHSLLIRDLKMNNKILPEYDYLVIDEGHNFPDEFTNQYTDNFDFKKNIYFLDGIYRNRGNILKRLEKNFKENIFYKDLVLYLDGVKSALLELTEKLRKTSDILKEKNNSFNQDKRIREEMMNDSDHQDFIQKIKDIKSLFHKTNEFFLKISQVLEEEEIYQDIYLEIRMVINQISEKIMILNDFSKPDFDGKVYWIKDTDILIAPLEVSQLIKKNLFRLKKSVIITSATLTVNNSFDFILNSFGTDEENSWFLQLDSPFNFKKQAKCHILKQDLDTQSLINYIEELICDFQGGSLILFTNHDFLRKTYYYLNERNPDRVILADGISGSRRNIIKKFRESKDSVLLGADSFWEGIDLEGEILNNLVMTKLPFLPPNRPIVEAALEKIQKSGGNNFYDYSIPKAVIKFRQGFGRLIRTESDLGNFYILDHRILNKNYGKIFLNSIPKMDKYLLKVLN